MTDYNSYYRPRKNEVTEHITACSTQSTVAGSALEADNCEHCRAPYGHYIQCPTINRATAEAHSLLTSERDTIFAHGLGIDLTK